MEAMPYPIRQWIGEIQSGLQLRGGNLATGASRVEERRILLAGFSASLRVDSRRETTGSIEAPLPLALEFGIPPEALWPVEIKLSNRPEGNETAMAFSRRSVLKSVATSLATVPLLHSHLWSNQEGAEQPAARHLDNPFAGATFYRNVDYVAAVNAAAERQGGRLGRQMRRVADHPTFVWMDSIAAVSGGNGYPRSLASHLDQALEQRANAIGIVIYNLPNRDCSALASNGELHVSRNGLARYRTDYIDAVYDVIRQPRYAGLRIVMVIEPDSLPNLITNRNIPSCREAETSGAYVEGVQYAVGRLRSLSNTYAYLDIGHAGWMGWPSNFNPFVDLLKRVGAGIQGGNAKVDGFVSNTANYNPFVEPYMTANQMIGGQPVRSLQGWYDWNDHIDEQSYATALRAALTRGNNAYPNRVGLLIDTSRNGWGGPNRPARASASNDLRTFVRATTIDRRIHKGNWGNQEGAGIGARPVANPAEHYHAFVWVKPPGESDGSSRLIPQGPENPLGRGFDRMCDPTYRGNGLNGNNPTGAMPDAPVAGRWFPEQFVQLVQNAFPAFEP
jgi:cellulose 1,4-beta-cellobiosidase